MLKKTLVISAMTGILTITCGFSWAEDGKSMQQQTQEQIYGSQLMTEQERIEHRSRMRAAKTVEEREQIRKEHHERMKERAKQRGVTLPDEPPARGGGMMKPGGGKGPGGKAMNPDPGGYNY